MSARKTFGEYLGPPTEWAEREEWYWPGISDVASGIMPEFLRRLAISADNIYSLPRLSRFARERWPTWWKLEDPSDPKDECYEILERCCVLLWADYLEWAEAKEDES